VDVGHLQLADLNLQLHVAGVEHRTKVIAGVIDYLAWGGIEELDDAGHRRLHGEVGCGRFIGLKASLVGLQLRLVLGDGRDGGLATQGDNRLALGDQTVLGCVQGQHRGVDRAGGDG
jgi:hypothetical protein